MRALVLSGGEGSRLRPITHTSAKQLIPVAGTPILFHALEAIADAGITEVGIIVGQTAAEVRSAVGDGSRWGLQVTYIPQDAPLGLAHAVITAREFVQGQPFLMYLGDNVLLEGLSRFVQEFERNRPDAQIFVARVPEPERFGVAVLDGDRVVRLVEKPREYVSDLALVGVYLFGDSILEAADTLEPSWRGEYEITEAIQWLVDHGRTVRAEMVEGWWKDTGKPDDLLEANRMMLSVRGHAIDGDVDEATSVEGDGRGGRGSQGHPQRVARPRRDRPGLRRGRVHRGSRCLGRAGLPDRTQRGRGLDRDGGLHDRGRARHRRLDPGPGRRGSSFGHEGHPPVDRGGSEPRRGRLTGPEPTRA